MTSLVLVLVEGPKQKLEYLYQSKINTKLGGNPFSSFAERHLKVWMDAHTDHTTAAG